MFRLVKILGDCDNVYDVRMLDASNISDFPAGCALIESGGSMTTCALTTLPEYFTLVSKSYEKDGLVPVIPWAENMVFKVEYKGLMKPTVGMKVGVTNSGTGVNYNGSGKGVILDIEPTEFDDAQKRIVYVKFRKT